MIRNIPHIPYKALLIASCCLLLAVQSHAQERRRILQLSGIILGQDSTSGLPGVHVYVPKAGRGTTSNAYGFFSMPVLVGDSVVVSAVGYQHQYFIVPDHDSEYLTIVFELQEDVTFLKEIEVTPFPTEEVFKEAVLALNLPLEDRTLDKKNLDENLLALIMRNTPMDGPMNQQNAIERWNNYNVNQYGPPINPLLNPFNWAKFIQSLKKNKQQ